MGKEFSQVVSVGSNSSIVGTGSLYDRLLVGVAAVEVKVGASKLVSRGAVTLCASIANTGNIYVGIDAGVTVNKYFYVLGAGAGINIELNPSAVIGIYAISDTAGQYVGVLESIS